MSKIQSTQNKYSKIATLLRSLDTTETADRTDYEVLQSFFSTFGALKGLNGAPATKDAEAARISSIAEQLLPLLDECSVDAQVKKLPFSVKPAVAVLTPCNPLHKTVQMLAIAKCNLEQLVAVLNYRQVKQTAKTLNDEQTAILAVLLSVDPTVVPRNWDAYENWLCRRLFGDSCTVVNRPMSNNDAAIGDALALSSVFVPVAAESTVLFATFGAFEDKVKKAARDASKRGPGSPQVAYVQGVPADWTLLKGKFFGDSPSMSALFELQDVIRKFEKQEEVADEE